MRILFVLLVLANLALFAAGQGFFGPPPTERGRDPERLHNVLHPETIHVPNDLDRQAMLNAPASAATPVSNTTLPPLAAAAPVPEPTPTVPATADSSPPTLPGTAEAAPVPPTEPAPAPASAQAPAKATEPLPPPAPVLVPAPTPTPATPTPRPAPIETVCREWGGFTDPESKRARQWVQKHAPGLAVQTVSEAGPASWMVLVPPAANLAAAQKTAAALNRQGIKDLFVIQEAGPHQYAISLGVFSQEKSARALAQSLQTKAGRPLSVVARPGPTRQWLRFASLEASQQAAFRQQALKQFDREWRTCKP